MEKFNYTITVEAPSKKIADMLIDHICKDNIDVVQLVKQNQEKVKESRILHEAIQNLFKDFGTEQEGKKKSPEPEIKKPTQKENFLKGLMEFEKVIQIIERCVNDETALDRIAQLLGIKTQKTTHE